MTNLRNELPVAVHIASGGDARVRTGGQVISLNEISSGSFQVLGATKYRAEFNTRTTGGMVLLMGYTSPVTLANASWVSLDWGQINDDVPEGTSVYFATVEADEFAALQGGEHDTLHISYYG